MPILGAHMSIAGGFHKAIDRALDAGCECVQVFTKNCNQWSARDITDLEARRFRTAVTDAGIARTAAHDSYLINLGSPDNNLWKQSVNALIDELRRADRLGIPFVVTHPGAFTTSNEQRGIRRIARALNEVHRRTRSLSTECVLETTAGQGTTLGWRFEHLSAILSRVQDSDRIGICFDTCHVFAAGYAMDSKRQYLATMAEFDRLLGLDRIRMFHLNDSLREQGSRVDRHTHIGQGAMGLNPFRYLLNDPRFRDRPMILETPKESENRADMDRINLQTLRGLLK